MPSLLEGNSVVALAQGARIEKAKTSPLITLMTLRKSGDRA